MMIEVDLEFFQTVYLVTDEDQRPRIITRFEIAPGNRVLVGLSFGTGTSLHYLEEITTIRDTVKFLNRSED